MESFEDRPTRMSDFLRTMTCEARLVRRETADGLLSLQDDVPVGRVYRVIPSSARSLRFFNTAAGVYHDKVVVIDVESGGWLPVELLDSDLQILTSRRLRLTGLARLPGRRSVARGWPLHLLAG